MLEAARVMSQYRYRHTLRFVTFAAEEQGLDTAWAEIQTLIGWRRDNSHWTARRADQARYWFDQEVRQGTLREVNVEELNVELANIAVHEHRSALFFIDLDQFKYVNDTCGHHAGDRLIGKVGDELTRSVGKGDVVAS